MTVRSLALWLPDVFGVVAIPFHIVNSENTSSKADREGARTKLGGPLLSSSANCPDDLDDFFEWISLCGPTCTRYISGADKFLSGLTACCPVLHKAAVNDDPIGSSTYSKTIVIIPSDFPFIHMIKLIFQLAGEYVGVSRPLVDNFQEA